VTPPLFWIGKALEPEERARLEAMEGLLLFLGEVEKEKLAFKLGFERVSMEVLNHVVRALAEDPSGALLYGEAEIDPRYVPGSLEGE
jgi:hypothetical protein